MTRGVSPATLSVIEFWALGFALIAAHAFMLHEWFYPSSYDAGQYVGIAREIAEHGPFFRFSGAEIRTYGYPFFLSFLDRSAVALGLPLNIVAFEAQLLLYLAAVFFLRAALLPLWPRVARIVFCGLMFNFYVLIYASTTLTESLSLTLLVFVATCWLRLYLHRESLWPVVAGSLAASYAMMVRPGSMFVVVAWIFGLLLIAWRTRPSLLRTLFLSVVVAVALAVPAWPQMANNIAYFHKRSLLPTSDLGKLHQVLGVQNFKYATGMPPVPQGAIFYRNPFYEGTDFDERAPMRWYLDYPVRGVATLAVHVFNMLDQDLLFTYARDLDPWYRVPLAIFNHAAVALGVIGLVMLVRRVRARRGAAASDALLMVLIVGAANLAMYAWTVVEMRYGAVLLMLLFPLACFAAVELAQTGAVRARRAALVGVTVYIAGALVLSGWVREQSALIRDARAAHHAGAGALPRVAAPPALATTGIATR